MTKLKIVSVVNDFDVFNRCIKNNENLKDSEFIVFDNTVENIGISERYNSFIDTIREEDDFWVAFIHQDFIFNENPLLKMLDLEKDSIYGPIGLSKPLFFLQYKPKFILKIYRRCMMGEIVQGEDNKIVGNRVLGNPKVVTLDCCCCFIHSSLVFKKRLRFDENLKFHMYVEDLCHSAKKIGVNSRVVQMNCRHLSGGNLNDELKKSVEYIKKKHKIFYINSTCFK